MFTGVFLLLRQEDSGHEQNYYAARVVWSIAVQQITLKGHQMDEQPGGLGRAIQVRRAELGLKRKELAERALLSYPYLSELETGTKTPSAKALRQLADALELSQAELLERADARPVRVNQRLKAGPAWGGLPPGSIATGAADLSGTHDSALELEQLGRVADIVAATVRAELAAWARTSLPALIRDEVRRALDEEGRKSK
ncbi:helix-turn-helix domain-containing protein [Micromonospora saelicesensis]|nr:helix-turn-helix transcriptional regulator [Micromonospora saelicesensis]